MIAYVLIEFDVVDIGDNHEDFGIKDVLGVFTKKKLLQKAVKELTEKYDGQKIYAIGEFEINEYYDDEEERDEDISEVLEEMVQDGIIDYTIGEDGQFYFHVTDKGKQIYE